MYKKANKQCESSKIFSPRKVRSRESYCRPLFLYRRSHWHCNHVLTVLCLCPANLDNSRTGMLLSVSWVFMKYPPSPKGQFRLYSRSYTQTSTSYTSLQLWLRFNWTPTGPESFYPRLPVLLQVVQALSIKSSIRSWMPLPKTLSVRWCQFLSIRTVQPLKRLYSTNATKCTILHLNWNVHAKLAL